MNFVVYSTYEKLYAHLPHIIYYIVVELVRDVGVIKVQLCACKLIHVHVIGTCAISDTGSMSTICHILDCIQNSNSTSNQRDEIVAVARQMWELPLLINLKLVQIFFYKF